MLNFVTDEEASVYLVVASPSDPVPSAAAVRSNPDFGFSIARATVNQITVDSLAAETSYVFYYVAEDAFGHLTALGTVNAATTAFDTTISIDNGVLVIEDSGTSSNDGLVVNWSAGNFTLSDANLSLTTAIPGAVRTGSRQLSIPDTGINGVQFVLSTGTDSVTIASMPTSLTGSLSIVGNDGNDAVAIQGAVSVGEDITIAAQTIAVTANLSAVGSGQIHLSAANSIDLNGAILTTDAGAISLLANQSQTPTGGDFHAISLLSSTVTTTSGSIEVRGVGGNSNTSNENFGVRLNESVISSTGSGENVGNIVIEGAAVAGSEQIGITIEGVGFVVISKVISVDADITINGSSFGSQGISTSFSTISSTGSGSVSLTGTSAQETAVSTNFGTISSSSQSLTINGTGKTGVQLVSTKISSSGPALSIQGSGSVGTVITGAKIVGTGSDVSLSGTGTTGTGLDLKQSVQVSSTTGDITLSGSAGSLGVDLASASVSTSLGGDIRVTTNTVTIGSKTTLSGSGTLAFAPQSSSTSIGLGGGSGTLNLDSSELARLTDGFSQIVIGDTLNGSGAIDIVNASFSDNLLIVGGSMTVRGLDASGQSVDLLARTGSISDGSHPSREAVADIKANRLALSAISGINVDSDPFDTEIASLSVSTESGDIAISNIGDLVIEESPYAAGVVIADTANDNSENDNISISAAGKLSVLDTVTNNDSGDIELRSIASGVAGDDIELNAELSGSALSIEAADDIFLNSKLTQSSDVRLVAGTVSSSGEVVQAGGLSLQVGSGDLVIAADLDIAVNSLSSTSHITLRSSSGKIVEVGDDPAIDISSATIGFEASTGIGSDSDDLDISVLYLAGVTNSGDINLSISGNASVDSAIGFSGALTGLAIADAEANDSGNDNITLTSDATLFVDDVSNLDGGTITISAKTLTVGPLSSTGKISLSSTNGTTLTSLSTLNNIALTGTINVQDASFVMSDFTVTSASTVLIANDGTDIVAGRFTNKLEASNLQINGQPAVLTYYGGDGNDIAVVMTNLLSVVTGTAGNDDLEVRRVIFDDLFSGLDVDHLQGLLNGVVVESRPIAAAGGFALEGQNGNDSLFVNYGASGGYFTETVLAHGGNENDTLRIGTLSAYESALTVDSLGTGTLSLTKTQNASASNVLFSDIESLDHEISASNVFLNLSTAADTATLSTSSETEMLFTTAPGLAVTLFNPASTLGIYGGSGNDSIVLQSVDANFTGTLFIDAGDGADTINASALSRHVLELGGNGNDTIYGSLGFDSLNAGAGNDVVYGYGGDDLLSGGRGADTIYAGNGDDGIYWSGGDGNDFIDGQAGTDKVGIAGADTAVQGERIEVRDSSGRVAVERFTDAGITPFVLSVGTVETIEIYAFTGDDLIDGRNLTLSALTIDAGDGADVVYGGSLADVLIGGLGADTIRGGGGNDVLLGGSDSDVLDGEAGDDRVRGQGASLDVLTGGIGNDTLDGGDGTDIVSETADQDFVLTNSGLTGVVTGTDSFIAMEDAALTGGTSANNINASAFTGRTTLSGGNGNDTLTGGSNVDFINGDDGDDVIVSGDGADNINGFAGNDSVDAGAGNDLVRGGAGRDSLDGGDGNDRLFGQGASFDVLTGGAGNDTLTGGTGDDSVSGNDGDDVFVWSDGDGTDVVEGGNGTDRQMVYASKSSAEGDQITVSDNVGRIALSRAAGALLSAFSLNLGSVERINVLLYQGNDSINGSGLTLARLNVQGGAGNDTIKGGSQIDYLAGDFGDDSIEGSAGADTIIAGGGADIANGGADVDTIDVSNNDAVDTVMNSALDVVFSNVDDILS